MHQWRDVRFTGVFVKSQEALVRIGAERGSYDKVTADYDNYDKRPSGCRGEGVVGGGYSGSAIPAEMVSVMGVLRSFGLLAFAKLLEAVMSDLPGKQVKLHGVQLVEHHKRFVCWRLPESTVTKPVEHF